jgi:hypothetical protein
MRASAVAYFSGFLVVVVLHVSGLEKKDQFSHVIFIISDGIGDP